MSDKKEKNENGMRKIRIEKVTLNIGAGKDSARLEKGVKLIKHLTGIEPVKTTTNKRIANWGIRPGLPIGCKLTLRDPEKMRDIIAKTIKAKDNELKSTYFDEKGSISFGIHEYIDLPKVEYNPEVGIMGFQICITLDRPGYRIKKRRMRKSEVNINHMVSKAEAVEFMKKEFGINVSE